MSFTNRVYILTKQIPKGKVTAYKEIAKAMKTKAYRAVGTALNKNPHGFFIPSAHKQSCQRHHSVVPCHRVINSDGRIGGFAAGKRAKIQLLKKEGIEIKDNKISLKKYLFKF